MTMPTWVYAVVFCALLVGIGYVVDRRVRAVRKDLVVPADKKGRTSVDGVTRARLEPGGAGGLGVGPNYGGGYNGGNPSSYYQSGGS
ncbi:MAG: hypothetical protein ABIQ18_16835 [Umezawaea sp.]